MRLATFNILHGRLLAERRVDPDGYAEAVASLDADVLALQEVDRDQERSHGLDLTKIAADAMGARDYRFTPALLGTPGSTWRVPADDDRPGTAAYGIALLSRHPVHRWEVVRLPALGVRVPFRFEPGRWPHLARDEPRVAVIATVATPLGEVVVAATHLSFLPGWNLVQLRRLRQALAGRIGPVVLMGDLNMSPELARRATGMRPLGSDLTFPADAPDRQIDHVLARDVAWSTTGRAVELPVSDHRALVVDVDEG